MEQLAIHLDAIEKELRDLRKLLEQRDIIPTPMEVEPTQPERRSILGIFQGRLGDLPDEIFLEAKRGQFDVE
jgi:hypothetical protein